MSSVALKMVAETFVPLAQAARLLGTSEGHVRKLADSGKLGTRTVPGGRRLFAMRDLILLAEESAIPQPA